MECDDDDNSSACSVSAVCPTKKSLEKRDEDFSSQFTTLEIPGHFPDDDGDEEEEEKEAAAKAAMYKYKGKPDEDAEAIKRKEQHDREKASKELARQTREGLKNVTITETAETEIRKEQHNRELGWNATMTTTRVRAVFRPCVRPRNR